MGDFYVRYYVGHKGKFGHEFLEFEFRPDGKYMQCLMRGCGLLLYSAVLKFESLTTHLVL